MAGAHSGMSDRLAFIGFMGSGKTTAARVAAKALGICAVDADDEIEARTDKPIQRVFAEDGEASFRAIEEQVAVELLDREPVVSLGGGAVVSSRVREALRDRTVIWMDVEVGTA